MRAFRTALRQDGISRETASDTIAAILEREPPWDRIPVAIGTNVRHLLRRCLEKDPKRRVRDIADARMELEDAAAKPEPDELAGAKSAVTRRAVISALVGAAAGAAVRGMLGSRWPRRAAARYLARFRIPLPEGAFAVASFNKRVAISPDGTRIAFTVIPGGVSGYASLGNDQFFLHSLSELEPKKLPVDVGAPFFSYDGRWVGVMGAAAGKPVMPKMAVDGGSPGDVCPRGYIGATWAADDTIYFVAEMPGGLVRVPAAGGEPTSVVKIDLAKGERQHRYPCALPGSKAILLTLGTADSETFDDARIAVLNIQTGQTKTLVEGGTHPRYSPSGHLLYARAGNVFAIRFDADRLETAGQAFPFSRTY